MSGRSGTARVRSTADGREVYLQMPPGGSLLVAAANAPRPRVSRATAPLGSRCRSPGRGRYASPKAGRRCRRSRAIAHLLSWTTFGEDVANFSGTASYTATFARPLERQRPLAPRSRPGSRQRARAPERPRARDAHRTAVPDRARRPLRCRRRTSSRSASPTSPPTGSGISIDAASCGRSSTTSTFPRACLRTVDRMGSSPPRAGSPLESGLLGPVTLTPLSAIR